MGNLDKNTNLSADDMCDAKEFLHELEIDVLARTLYGEARGETLQGIEAVAHVVLNRVAIAEQSGGQYWWGNDIVSVCQMPYQFSCWNPGDPNRAKLMAVTSDNKKFSLCLQVARKAVYGQLGVDITKGANHYHTTAVKPKWSVGQTPCAQFGTHVFFKL